MGSGSSKASGGGASANRGIIRKGDKEDQFTVLTYSVLAESTLSDAAYPYWPKKDRKLKKRHAVLVAELKALHADVMCLQNVEASYYKMLQPELRQLGYEGQFVAPPGGGPIGLATFWNSATFRLLKSHVISMDEVSSKVAKKHKASAKSAGLQNDSYSQTTLLQLVPEKHAKCHAVVVANTRLMWDSQQPDVQTLEAALLMRELEKYAGHVHEFKEAAGLPEVSIGYIVAGDLAASPKSPAYAVLKKGALEAKDAKKLQKCPKVLAGKGMQADTKPLVELFSDVLSHRWQLKSAYAVVAGHEPEYTVYTDQEHACRDYIWFSSENLNANTALQVPDEMFVASATGLPSATYPSDHLSLVAGFRFKKTDAFTSMLPFDRAAAVAGTGAEEEDDDLKARDLDKLLGFSTPMDSKRYDRYGYERTVSGIAVGEDMTSEHWRPAPTRNDGTRTQR